MQVETSAEQLFFNTVRIETFSNDGLMTGNGTGFFFRYRFGNFEFPFIVTNKHVAQDIYINNKIVGKWHYGTFSFVQGSAGKPNMGEGLGYKCSSEEWARDWTGHPDPKIDVAVFPCLPITDRFLNEHTHSPFFVYIDSELIPTAEQIATLDAFEEVVIVGYPDGLWDNVNYLPMMRRGTTATPLQVDFEGQPLFVIDASIFPGSSGSPVYLMDKGLHVDRAGNINTWSRTHLLGIVSRVFSKTQTNEIKSIPAPNTITFDEKLDLGIVVKSRAILETCEHYVRTNCK